MQVTGRQSRREGRGCGSASDTKQSTMDKTQAMGEASSSQRNSDRPKDQGKARWQASRLAIQSVQAPVASLRMVRMRGRRSGGCLLVTAARRRGSISSPCAAREAFSWTRTQRRSAKGIYSQIVSAQADTGRSGCHGSRPGPRTASASISGPKLAASRRRSMSANASSRALLWGPGSLLAPSRPSSPGSELTPDKLSLSDWLGSDRLGGPGGSPLPKLLRGGGGWRWQRGATW